MTSYRRPRPKRRSNDDSSVWRKLRLAIIERDGRMCRWPGCTATTDLTVHHKVAARVAPHLRYAEQNLITLCRFHHGKVDGGRSHERRA